MNLYRISSALFLAFALFLTGCTDTPAVSEPQTSDISTMESISTSATTTTANSTEADTTNGTTPSVGNTTTAGTVVQTGSADTTQTVNKSTMATNDANMGVSMEDYRKAYLRFVANIRRQYPDSYIVCTTAGGNTTVWDTIDEVVEMRRQLYSDNKIAHFIYMYDDIAGTVGADGHPSVYGHEQIGAALADYIREKLGW